MLLHDILFGVEKNRPLRRCCCVTKLHLYGASCGANQFADTDAAYAHDHILHAARACQNASKATLAVIACSARARCGKGCILNALGQNTSALYSVVIAGCQHTACMLLCLFTFL